MMSSSHGYAFLLILVLYMFQVGMNDSVSLQVRKKVNKELMLLISQLHIQVRENGKYCRKDAIKLHDGRPQGPPQSSSS